MWYINIIYFVIKASLLASIMALLILIIKLVMGKRLAPNLHYYIWLLLIIKLIVPYGPQSKISLYNLAPADNNVKIESSLNKASLKDNSHVTQISDSKAYDDKFTVNTVDSLKGNVDEKSKVSFNYSSLLFTIWIFGISVGAIYILCGTIRMKKITALPYQDEKIKDILNSCQNILKLRKKVGIVITNNIYSPSLYGLFKPIIIIPKKITMELSEKELTYIIMHELFHLKRKDILLSWISSLLKLIYWFNPIIIFSLNKMQKDCEICCDASVLRYLAEDENLAYGNTIINVLELVNKSTWLPGTTSIVIKKSDLKRRIEMISKYKNSSINAVVLGVIAILIVAVVGLTGGITKADNKTDVEKRLENKNYSTENVVQPSKSGVILNLTHKSDVNGISDNKNLYVGEKEISYLIKIVSLPSTTAIYINDILITDKTKLKNSDEEGYILIDGKKLSTKDSFTIKAFGDKNKLYSSLSFPGSISFSNISIMYNYNYKTFGEEVNNDSVKIIDSKIADYKAMINNGNIVKVDKFQSADKFNTEIYNTDKLDNFIGNAKNNKDDKVRLIMYTS